MSETTSKSSGGPRLLDVPAEWTMIALGKKVVPADGRVDVVATSDTVTAFDTASGDLADAGISLGRGAGAGAQWTLRIDGTGILFPAAGRGVPAEIRELLLGVRAGAALRATGRADVSRTEHHVLGSDGAELGTVTEVLITPLGGDEPAEPARHVEVSGWRGAFVDAAVRRLVKADALPRPADRDEDGPGGPDTVGSALLRYLRTQRRAVIEADLTLRRAAASDDTAKTVHAFRVAIRRTRSALRVVDVVDPERRLAFDEELRWLSGVLGAVRDLHVLRTHLSQSLTAAADRGDLDIDLAAAETALTAQLDAD